MTRRQPAGRQANRVRLCAAVLVAAGGVGALAGCGIQPTPAPVYAGEPALRTACPPTGSAASQLSEPSSSATTPATASATASGKAEGGRSPAEEPIAALPASGPPSPVGAQVMTAAPSAPPTTSASPLPSEPPSATPSCLQPSER